MLMHVYGREWWFDTVNYGTNYGAVGSADAGLGAAWEAMGEDGRRAELVRDQADWAGGAHPAVPRGAAASSEAQREATFWGLADLWEEDMMVELQAERGQ